MPEHEQSPHHTQDCRCALCVRRAIDEMVRLGLVERVGHKFKLTSVGKAFAAAVRANKERDDE